MGDFQPFEQDFYQSGYYIDDQGHTVAYYETHNSADPGYDDTYVFDIGKITLYRVVLRSSGSHTSKSKTFFNMLLVRRLE